jgi:hypothetical protein
MLAGWPAGSEYIETGSFFGSLVSSISHAVSAFYDTHHGLNNAVALPRVWAFNMPVAYKRFADIAGQMGVDTHGMTDVQAAEAALAAGIRLLRDVGIPERFIDVKQDSYSKNRLGQGPTKFYEKAKVIKGDKADVDRNYVRLMERLLVAGNYPGLATHASEQPWLRLLEYLELGVVLTDAESVECDLARGGRSGCGGGLRRRFARESASRGVVAGRPARSPPRSRPSSVRSQPKSC